MNEAAKTPFSQRSNPDTPHTILKWLEFARSSMAPALRDRRNLPKAKIVPMAKKSKIVAAPPAVVVLPPDSDKSLVGDDILKIEDIPFTEEDISEISDSEDSDFRDESDVEITYEDMEVQGVSAFVPKLSNGHTLSRGWYEL